MIDENIDVHSFYERFCNKLCPVVFMNCPEHSRHFDRC